jgi:hypothetical protein
MASRVVHIDASLAAAAAATTWAMTSCISSWARAARISLVAHTHLRPDNASVSPYKLKMIWTSRKAREIESKSFHVKKTHHVAGSISSSNVWRAHSNPCSRVLHAVASSSSSTSSPTSKVAARGAQTSSRARASLPRRLVAGLRPSPPRPPGFPGRRLLSHPQGRRALGGRWLLSRPQGRRALKGLWRAGLAPEPPVDGVFWYTKHVHYTLVWI